ncbi:outer membrane autotransporter barrel domain-containing protein [Planoprotostelium fungivorum]|uniref:receptor protein-tyrosine kinase n=1 Tax=Planoprotostelium fungivorum TaxID=1890364 RepID=A0A2P6MN71_9EUKA|nr:outer membrane autotransporter barrel domain-containing protein [Planoprotostelium fungivorum]
MRNRVHLLLVCLVAVLASDRRTVFTASNNVTYDLFALSGLGSGIGGDFIVNTTNWYWAWNPYSPCNQQPLCAQTGSSGIQISPNNGQSNGSFAISYPNSTIAWSYNALWSSTGGQDGRAQTIKITCDSTIGTNISFTFINESPLKTINFAMRLNCSYYFNTPYIGTVSVSSNTTNGVINSPTILWIAGAAYGTDSTQVSVTVGGLVCPIQSMDNFNILCLISPSLALNASYSVGLTYKGITARNVPGTMIYLASTSNATSTPTTGGTSTVSLYSFSNALLFTCARNPTVTIGSTLYSSAVREESIVELNERQLINSTLSFNVPAGSGIYPMSVTCGNTVVWGFFRYNPAVVYGISQVINASNAQITISGNNFGPTASGIYQVWVGQNLCSQLIMVIPHTVLNCTLVGTYSPTTSGNVNQNAIVVASGGDSVVPNVQFPSTMALGAPYYLGQNPELCRQKCISTAGCKSWVYDSCGSSNYACSLQSDLSSPSWAACQWGGQILTGSATGQTSVTPVYMNNPLPSLQYTDAYNSYNLDYFGDSQNSLGNVDYTATDANAYTYYFNPGGLAHPAGAVNGYTLVQRSSSQNYALMSPYGITFSTNSSGTTFLTGYGSNVGGCGASRKTVMALVCDATLPSPVFTFVGESPTCTYNFVFRFNCLQAASNPYFKNIYASSGDLYLVGQWGTNPSVITVSIAGIPCPLNTSLFTSSMLVCTAPPMLASTALVTVLVNNQLARNGIYLWSVASPAVSSVTAYPTAGGTMTVIGNGFGKDPTAFNITVGGFPCPVLSLNLNGTNINCNLTSTNGTVSVIMRNFGQLAPPNLQLMLLPPNITSTSLVPTLGSSINITGTGFGNSVNQVSVTANGVDCPLISVTSTMIVCTVGSGVGTQLPLLVTVGGLNVSSTFSYLPPTIIDLRSVNTPGGIVNVFGANFGNGDNDIKVTFSGTVVQSHWNSDSYITFTAPAGQGLKPVTFSVGGQSLPISFYYNPPEIYTVSSVDTSGGQVIVNGRNFGTDATAIGIVVADPKVMYVRNYGLMFSPPTIITNHYSFSFNIDPGTGTSKMITIYVGGVNSSAGSFSYNPPTVTALSGVSTDGGTVAITGKNFGPTGTSITALINSVPYVGTTTVGHTVCSISVNGGVGANYPASVTVSGQKSPTVNLFSYLPPVLMSSSPVSTQGPSTVSITGQNFGLANNMVNVTLNGLSCGNVLIHNSSYLTCITGDGAGGANYPAAITVGNQNASNPSLFSYRVPAIYAYTQVGTSGGFINITGANFGNNVQLVSVNVGGINCTSITMVINHTLLQCYLPGGTGSVPLIVTVNGQVNAASLYSYTFPSVSFTSQPNTTGGTLTITGSNFGSVLGDISVTLCTNIVFHSVDSINCIVPAGSGYDVGRVITVKGQSTLFTFSYVPPTITSISLPPTQGGNITIYGSQFSLGTSVMYNGIGCNNVVVGPLLNNITCVAPAGTGNVQVVVVVSNQTVYTTSQYQPPSITFTQPISPSGGTVQLGGQNLGSNRFLIGINIGTIACNNVQIITPHLLITCDLPPGVGGNLSSIVTVNVLYGSFTYSFSPPTFLNSTASPTLGGLIIITGTNLGSQPSQVIVSANGRSCSGVTIVNTDVISCLAAAGTGTNLSLALLVGGQMTGGSFSYLPPTVSSASSSGVANGVYLSGTNLGNDVTVMNVTVTNSAGNSTRVCGGIRILNPSLALNCSVTGAALTQGYKVQIVVNGQTSAPAAYSNAAPRIQSVTSAPTSGGIITITGSDFDVGLTVTIGGNVCNITYLSLNTVNCTVGPMIDGRSLIVNLTSSYGASVSGTYTYQLPTITSTTKASTAGDYIVINGTNFPASSSQIIVLVNGAYCFPLDIIQPFTSLRCKAIGGVGTDIPVNVSVAGSPYTGSTTSYLPPSFSYATSAPTSGGIINIYGSQFGSDASALVITANGAPCRSPSIVIASTMVSCNATVGTGSSNNLNITVASQSTTGTFSYLPPTPLNVTMAPTSGGLVTVSGVNFGTISSSTSITINGQPCLSPVTSSNFTTLNCMAQPDAGSMLALSVTVDGLTGSANIFNYLPPSVYSVTSVSTAGGSVVVDGRNFGTKASAISVTINGQNFPVVLSVNHTRFSFTAPNGTLSTTFYLSVQGQSITSSFSYLPPNITLVSSPRTSGSVITISGFNFGSVANLISVTFPSASGDVTVSNVNIITPHTMISCTAPSGTGRRPLRAIVNTLSSSVYNFAYQLPTVITVSPLNSTGGNLVITGDNFGQLSSLVQVTVGGSTCSSIIINTAYTVITCTLPAHLIGANIPMAVTVDDLTGLSNYRSQPPILFGASSPPTTGGPMVLSGINFGDASNVSVIVNGQLCPLITASDSIITCNATRSGSYHPTGSIFSSGQNTSIPFVPYQGPSISSISLGEPNGGVVTLSGFNFGNYAGYISVSMDGISCTNVTITSADYNVSCVAPAANGPQRMAVITVDGISSLPFLFRYLSPVITVASPVSTRGGITNLTGFHLGDGFNGSVSVTINNVDCPIVDTTASTVSCIVGAGVGSKQIGSITVYNVTSAFTFSYLPPIISSTTSTNTTGGLITISGDNFGVDSSLTTVIINGTLACNSVTMVIPHTSISCQLISGTGTGLPLSVTVAGLTGSGVYSYLPPFITSITSPPTRGGSVTFIGLNFGSDPNDIRAYFDGHICTDVTIIDPSHSFRCTATNNTGTVQAYVVVDSLPSTLVDVSYQGPTVSKIRPAPQSGGYLYIIGVNFGYDIEEIDVSLPCVNKSIDSFSPETLSCYLEYDIVETVTFNVTVSGQTTNFTAIVRQLSPNLASQYDGVIRLMVNASTAVPRPTQNFCFGYAAIRCSVEGNIRSLNLSAVPLFTLFDGLCDLVHLEELYFRSVNASGSIPSCLDGLVSLRVIDLGENNIQGVIPDLSSLSQLTSLLLDHNHLGGSLPSTLANHPLSVFDASSNDITGYVPAGMTLLPSLTRLRMRDNYLSGFASNVRPINDNFTCDMTDNFLSCPLPSWVSSLCNGICGQSTLTPSMNITRETLRAVYSTTSTALFYFTSGSYNDINLMYASMMNQSVTLKGVGNVTFGGNSQISFSGASSVSLDGFTFYNGPTLYTLQCSSVNISNCNFNRASGASTIVSLIHSSFTNNLATPIVIASARSADLFISQCNFINNIGQAMSVSGSIGKMDITSSTMEGHHHQLMGTVGITATVDRMYLNHVTWYNNSAMTGAVLLTSSAIGQFWASDLTVKLNSASVEGGAFVFAASVQQLYLQNSIFDSNSAQTGGAMSFKLTSDNVTLYNTSFAYHTAAQGCAVNFDATAVIDVIHFTSVNVTQGNGQRGAVHLPGLTNSTFTDCTFIENLGGSIYGSLYAGSVTCLGTSFSNNTANEGAGIALYGSTTSVNVVDSTFYGNEALSQGADVTVEMSLSSFSIYNCTFTYSTAHFQGAAVNIGGSSKIQNITVEAATMRGCDAFFGSALAVAGQCPTVTVKDSSFIENSATFEGAAIYIADRSVHSVYIIASKFEGNFASSGGAVKYTDGVVGSVLVIDGSSFIYNEAITSTGGAVIVQKSVGNFSVSNSYFANNEAQSGGAIYLSQSIAIPILLRNNTFDANVARSNGGALCVMQSLNTSVVDSTFTSNQGSSGASIWINFVGKIPLTFTLNRTTISRSISTVSGALLLSSIVPSSQVSFLSFDSTWTENEASFNGGGLLLSGLFTLVQINGGLFSSNNASTGGAISTAGALSISSSVSFLSIYNTFLLHNTAPTGGALSNIGAIDVVITSCDISYNSATSTFGGGILYQPKTNGLASLSIYNTTVRANTAKSGGGLYISPSTTAIFTERSNIFLGNSATSLGGAVIISGEISSVTSRGSTWSFNSASDGAAFYSTSPSFTFISDAFFLNNSVTGNGGAVSSLNAGSVNIDGSSFSGNRAGGSGGGLSVIMRTKTKRADASPPDRVLLSNLTFVENNGANGGRTQHKSLFRYNVAGNGGGVATSTGASISDVKFNGNAANSGSAFTVTNSPGDVSLSNVDYGDSQIASVPKNVTLGGDGASSLTVDCGQGYTSSSDNGVTSCIALASVHKASSGLATPVIIGISVAAASIIIIIIVAVALLIRSRNVQSRMRPVMEFDLQSFTTALPKSTVIEEAELKNLVQIGRGAFGIVYKAHWRAADVAVKQLLNQDLLAKEEIESFVREVQLLERLRPHPNVVLFLGVIPPPNLALVTEFCEGGDLLSYIEDHNPNIEMRTNFISDIAVGMLHLHNENIIHRDLAARNILLTGSLRCKVTDFGFSRKTESSEEQTKTTSTVGPLKWMAPEALTQKVYSNKSDVYSFSITMWEILTGEEPYMDLNVIDVAIKVATMGLRPAVPAGFDPKLENLMRVCWETDPARRPDFAAISAHLANKTEEPQPLVPAEQPGASSNQEEGTETVDKKGMILSLVILIGTVTSSARVLGHKVAFGEIHLPPRDNDGLSATTIIMMTLLNGYMLRCAFTKRRHETYRWIPLLLTLLAALMIMAEPSRHLFMDFGLLSSQFFSEYRSDCDSETLRCLSRAGIIFTVLFTYIGFVLLFWGTMWNAGLWPKLKAIPKKWRQIRENRRKVSRPVNKSSARGDKYTFHRSGTQTLDTRTSDLKQQHAHLRSILLERQRLCCESHSISDRLAWTAPEALARRRNYKAETERILVLSGRNIQKSGKISAEVHLAEQIYHTDSKDAPNPEWNLEINTVIDTTLSEINILFQEFNKGGVLPTAFAKITLSAEELFTHEIDCWITLSPPRHSVGNGVRNPNTSLGEIHIQAKIGDIVGGNSLSGSFSGGSLNGSISASSSRESLSALLSLHEVENATPKMLASSMLTILEKYKIKSEGFLPEDTSKTCVACFKALLRATKLHQDIESCMEKWIATEGRFNGDPTESEMKECGERYKRSLMNDAHEKVVIDEIMIASGRSGIEMREVCQDLMVTILSGWGLNKVVVMEYSREAYTKRYEDGFVQNLGLTGLGKKFLPFFGKVVISTGVILYTTLRDTYEQYIDNYFQHRIVFLNKLPNPDYYGRLGGACYESFIMKIGKTKSQKRREFLQFVFQYANSDEKQRPQAPNKYCLSFEKSWHKLTRSHNRDKYISTAADKTSFNFLAPAVRRSPSLASIRGHGTPLLNEPKMGTQPTLSHSASVINLNNNAVAPKARSLEGLSFGLSFGKKSATLTDIERKPEPSNSRLLIFDNDIKFCGVLYECFCSAGDVLIHYTQLSDERARGDCIILPSNAYGLHSSNKVYLETSSYLGSQVMDDIRKYIVDNYMGEMPLYNSFVLSIRHDRVKFVVYTAAHVYDKVIASAQQTLWSALCAVDRYNRYCNDETMKINSIITKAILAPQEGYTATALSIHRTWLNYCRSQNNYRNKPARPVVKNVEDAVAREKEIIIAAAEFDNPKCAKDRFETMLLQGYISRRGYMDLDEVHILLEYLTAPNVQATARGNSLRLQAAKALADYAFPEETTPGLRSLILSKGGMAPILDLASHAKIQVHHEIPREELKYNNKIAEGAGGDVYVGEWNNYAVALKKSGESFLGYNAVDFHREVAIMSILRHPNIMICHGATTTNRDEMIIISEWIPNGSLRDVLERNEELTWPRRLTLAIQIMQGIEYLHSLQIIHGDIKSNNVLLDTNSHVKLIDFGVSRVLNGENGALGTTQWLAPEVFSGEGEGWLNYTLASDIYSYGILLWELISPNGKLPWDGVNVMKIPELVVAGERPQLPSVSFVQIPQQYRHVMTSCWHSHPSKRPTASQVVGDLRQLASKYHIYL